MLGSHVMCDFRAGCEVPFCDWRMNCKTAAAGERQGIKSARSIAVAGDIIEIKWRLFRCPVRIDIENGLYHVTGRAAAISKTVHLAELRRRDIREWDRQLTRLAASLAAPAPMPARRG